MKSAAKSPQRPVEQPLNTVFLGLTAVALLSLMLVPVRARAVDLNVSGSVQADYMASPLSPPSARPPGQLIDGFTTEASVKLAVDLSPHLAANVKACWSCHGLEVGMAYADYRVVDEFTLRFGRFNPSFGEFQLRHDVANHRTSDKPLPYDMGRALYFTQFNRAVLPVPYADNGLEIFGSHFFGNAVQIEYAVHAVAGLRSLADHPFDVDFIASRQPAPYVVDNNFLPSVGGRIGAMFRLSDRADLTVGLSGIHGPYDRLAQLNYTILGSDMYLRVGRTKFRMEYLLRRTEMVSDPTRYEASEQPGPSGTVPDPPFMTKDGWYVELEQPIGSIVELVARWDGLRRFGNVQKGSPLDVEAGMMRWTLGATFSIERGFRIKASGELYQLWGIRDAPSNLVLAGHLSAVASF